MRHGAAAATGPVGVLRFTMLRSVLYRCFSAEQGADIAHHRELAAALMLLVAACEQAAEELGRADVTVDGLAAELETLSVRLRSVLAQDRIRAT